MSSANVNTFPSLPKPPLVPPSLLVPSAAFRRRAWILGAAIVTFVLGYLGTMVWLGWLLYVRFTTGEGPLILPAFLLIVLGKGLLFSAGNWEGAGVIELNRTGHPRLHAFIDELCARTGTSPPRRVLINGRVNAAAIKPLTFRSFFPGGPHDLLLGAPLFEALNVSELGAVIAHELGHFSQKTTSLSRWVYLSQMAARRLVAQRDAIDDVLEGVSKAALEARYHLSLLPFAMLLSAVGWLFRVLVWAIRFWVQAAYFVVVWAHRQLSQELEFDADLVAVSAVGSDAGPRALYKLSIADEIWDGALDEMTGAVFEGKSPPNLTRLQRQLVENFRYILGESEFGEPPRAAANGERGHRIFETDLLEAPRHWATHPPNNSREANAKRSYVACAMNTASPWELLDEPVAVQEAVTVEMVKRVPVRGQVLAMTEDEALERLNRKYRREALNPRYKGRYLRGSMARMHASPESLGSVPHARPRASKSDTLPNVYPDDYAVFLRRLERKLRYRAQLIALRFGAEPSRARELQGERLSAGRLNELLAVANSDVRQLQTALLELDRHGREAFLSLAQELGRGWEQYYRDLLALTVFSAHQSLALERAIRHYHMAFGAIDFRRDVTRRDRHNLAAALTSAVAVMQSILETAQQVELPELVRDELGRQWRDALPPHLPLAQPEAESIFDSVDQGEKWMRVFSAACEALENACQDALLRTESYFEQCVRDAEDPGAAPPRGRLPVGSLAVQVDLTMGDIPSPTWGERIGGWLGPGYWAVRSLAAAGVLVCILAIMFDW